MGKTISFTSTPDYLGVLTRSAFAGLAQTIKRSVGEDRSLRFIVRSVNLDDFRWLGLDGYIMSSSKSNVRELSKFA